MKTYTLTKVSATDSKKDGSKLINKFGKTYWRVGIQTTEHPNEWINGFMNAKPEWKEGDTVELEVTESMYNDKLQKSFAIPKKEDQMVEGIEMIQNRIVGINLKLDKIIELLQPKKKSAEDEFYDEQREDSPF